MRAKRDQSSVDAEVGQAVWKPEKGAGPGRGQQPLPTIPAPGRQSPGPSSGAFSMVALVIRES